MTTGTAWLFPGHGAQYPGMGRGFPFATPAVADIFSEAESLCSHPLRRLSVDADAATLRDPSVLEPLLAAFSLAYAALLHARGRHPIAVAGYSAGAIGALHCAGVIDRTAALTLAARRGRVLTAAAPHCKGRMLAVFDLPVERMLDLVSSVSAGRVSVAGWNAPEHMTIVGEPASITRASEAVRLAGGKVFPVDVAGAWHCAAAAHVAAQVEALLGDIEFQPPLIPYYCSVSGERETQPQRLKKHLSEQIHQPVYWHAAVANALACEPIGGFIEVGCGRALRGLTQRSSSHSATPIPFHNLFDHLEIEHA